MKILIPLSIIVLVSFVGFGLATAIRQQVNTVPPKTVSVSPQTERFVPPQQNQVAPQVSKVQANVMIAPENSTVAKGGQITYQVTVDPGQNQVVGIETHFTYDPALLTFVSAVPGPGFTKPEILMQQNDAVKGTFTYAIGTFTPSAAHGPLFMVTFKPTAKATGALQVAFDRVNTKVALRTSDGSKHFTQNETAVNFSEQPVTLLP
jgi:hypothetical protein